MTVHEQPSSSGVSGVDVKEALREKLITALDYQLSSDEKVYAGVVVPAVTLLGVCIWRIYDAVPTVTSWSNVWTTTVVVVTDLLAFGGFLIMLMQGNSARVDDAPHRMVLRVYGAFFAPWAVLLTAAAFLGSLSALGWIWVCITMVCLCSVAAGLMPSPTPGTKRKRAPHVGFTICRMARRALVFTVILLLLLRGSVAVSAFKAVDNATAIAAAVALVDLNALVACAFYWMGHMDLLHIRQGLFLGTLDPVAANLRLRDKTCLGVLVGADPAAAAAMLESAR